jgi:hypothetical protein
MKSHISTIALILHLFSVPLLSQVLGGDICLSPVEGKDLIPARPLCGWDSLQRNLWFPEISRRAGVRSIYLFDFAIGSDSTITKFNWTKVKHFNSEFDLIQDNRFQDIDADFIIKLQNHLKTTKWTSAFYKGKPCNVKLPIFFNLYGFVKKLGIAVNVPLPLSVDAPSIVYDNKDSDY